MSQANFLERIRRGPNFARRLSGALSAGADSAPTDVCSAVAALVRWSGQPASAGADRADPGRGSVTARVSRERRAEPPPDGRRTALASAVKVGGGGAAAAAFLSWPHG